MPHAIKVQYGKHPYEGYVHIDGHPVACRLVEVVFDPSKDGPGLPYVRLEILALPLEFEEISKDNAKASTKTPGTPVHVELEVEVDGKPMTITRTVQRGLDSGEILIPGGAVIE